MDSTKNSSRRTLSTDLTDDYQDLREPINGNEKTEQDRSRKEENDVENQVSNPDTSTSAQGDESHHLHGVKLVTVVGSLMVAVFCVALDNTIITTAIPRITDDFHALDDVGWYGSAYLLTTCSFQILYANFYRFFNVKWVFLTALLIFELGSLVCALAPTSTAFIIGRAISGLGAAGMFTGATTAVAQIAPVSARPLITSLLGGLFGFASLGGIFADKVSWRWCFYINLPLGAISVVGVVLFLRVDQQLERLEGGILQRLKQFDPLGNTFFISCVVCLLLALQWGGSTYPYSDGRIITLFTMFGVLLIAFVGVEIFNRDFAIIPRRIIAQRSIAFGTLFAFCVGGATFVVVFYLPIYFQAIKGVSPIVSAVHTLPMILSQLVGVISSGALTNKIGYYMPFIFASAILIPIGSGLLTTFSVDLPMAKWIGYQIVIGFGVGFGFQQASVAAQVVLPLKDIPTGVAIVFSALFLGGTLFLSVAENVFATQLQSNIDEAAIPGFTSEMALKAGALELRSLVDVEHLPRVLVAYDSAITKAFQVGMIVGCVAILGAVGMEWRSVRKNQDESGAEHQSL